MTGYRRKFRCLIPEKGRTIYLQQVQKAPGSIGTENTATNGRHSSVLWCLTKQGDSTQNLSFSLWERFILLSSGLWQRVVRMVGTCIWKVSTTYICHPEDGVCFSETSMIIYYPTRSHIQVGGSMKSWNNFFKFKEFTPLTVKILELIIKYN